ncbi:MAG TPA: DUF177 domain-containing protein [Bacillota bacterium]|nr:DUF177 domain-containing protein [Bacillota bacterium]HOG52838.1 DUF177 domain-containing protein [Bacillota bacterium]
MRAFLIDVESISGQTGSSLEVDLSSTGEGIELDSHDLELIGYVSYKGTVGNIGNAYAVDGTIKAKARFVCDRCLTRFTKDIEIPLNRLFTEAGYQSEGFDLDDVEKMTGDEIDLAPQIREELILSIPIRNLCREDCKGICPQCGKDLNKGECSCGRSV